MPACQISFAEFARFLSEAFFPATPAAAPSTPPVQQTAVEVVAHPVAVGGGGCIPAFEGPIRHVFRGVSYFDLRDDYEYDVDTSGDGMDAPPALPSGSHMSEPFGKRSVMAWAFGCARGGNF